MDKHIGLRMAKASQEDIAGGFELAAILDAIDKNQYPSYYATPADRDAAEEAEAIPTVFDPDDFDHLKHLHSLLTDLLDRRRGFSLWRVVMGMETILRNDILDPDDDCLAIHPKFAAQTREVPDGWALVPVDPTEQMIRSGAIWCRQSPGVAPTVNNECTAAMSYRAMLAAAPKQGEPT